MEEGAPLDQSSGGTPTAREDCDVTLANSVHGGSLGLEGRSKFKELLAAGAPRHPIGRFRPRRPGGRGTFSNFELWAPEVALGLLAVLAQNFLGALRAQSEGQGNLSMQGATGSSNGTIRRLKRSNDLLPLVIIKDCTHHIRRT